MEQFFTSFRITELLALLGAFLYAIGDVLLLASMGRFITWANMYRH